jgi:hypothetical protein
MNIRPIDCLLLPQPGFDVHRIVASSRFAEQLAAADNRGVRGP